MDNSLECRSNRRKGIHDFGADILLRIFSRLPPIPLAHCSVVCSSWYHVISATPHLWKTAYLLDHKRVEVGEFETASAPSSEKSEVDWRSYFIDEELRSRPAHGLASARKWKAHSGRMAMGQIASGSSDQMVRIWCVKTLKCLEQYKAPKKVPVVQVEFDESKVMGAAGKEVLVWSRRGNRRLLRHMGGHSEICSMCYADSDLAAGCVDGTVRVFDLYSSRCTQIFRLHSEPVKAVVMDIETQTMASGSSDGTIQLFDLHSGEKIASLLKLPAITGITCMHLSAVKHKLFAGTRGGDLYCFDLRSQKTLWKKRFTGYLTCLHSPAYSSSTIGLGGVDGAVKIFDMHSSERIATFQAKVSRLPASPILGMALGMTKLVSSHADSSMVLWQLAKARSVSTATETLCGREERVVLP